MYSKSISRLLQPRICLGRWSCIRSLLSVPEGDTTVITIANARLKLKELVGSAESWSSERDQSVMQMSLAKDQSELPRRKMIDSYREVIIPLGQDSKLREKYINFFNGVRLGRILEDLDTMAVWIGYTHNTDLTKAKDQKSPLSIVTAAVDRIDVKENTIEPNCDIRLRGHVSWAGTSSMEVTMDVDQWRNNHWDQIILAKFLMVARDPWNRGKACVHPLQVEGPEEEELHNAGEANKTLRKQQAQESLLRVPPSEQERLDIHDLFLKTLDEKAATLKHPIKPEGSVWMEDALLKNIIICFPQERNLYNKIFGGFLMRQAMELAWASACVYSKKRPFITAIDDILFRKPVEIGSLLYLSSQIVYTSGSDLQVKVHAEVVDPRTSQHETTNIFHFTFKTEGEVQPIVPKTYAEFMMYLDGKRHYEVSMQERNKL